MLLELNQVKKNILNQSEIYLKLTLQAPISQNGQTLLNNSSANCRRIV